MLIGPSLGAGKGRALTAFLLVGLGVTKSGSDVFVCLFVSSTKCHHVHLLAQALGSGKKEDLQEGFLGMTPCLSLFWVPKGLKLWELLGHLTGRGLYWPVPYDMFSKTQAMASTWTDGRQGAGLMKIILSYPLLNGIERTALRDGKGLGQGQLRKKGTGLKFKQDFLTIFSFLLTITSLLPPSNPPTPLHTKSVSNGDHS